MDLLYVMYMGGPDSLEGIEEFLYNLFSDKDIIDFKIGKLQNFVAKIIAKRRSKKVMPDYIKMGGSSPQIKHLQNLLQKVKEKYETHYQRELCTEVGMCYYKPFIEETVKTLQNEKFEKIFVMTMYPQYSYTTSGACFKRFYSAINVIPPTGNFKIIPYWYKNEKYNKCIEKRIKYAANELKKDLRDCYILFSAHSLPEYTLKKGDVYARQIHEQIDIILKNLEIKGYELAFQSRTGPIKWLGPETKDVIEKLSEKGIDNVIVVPISFVSDHIETLIELDEQYIKNAKEKGINIVRTSSLNDSDDFAEAIISILEE
ncbi:ferrochelatase [Deferribacter autotrophicus]|uniref:Ferrochelatase n=1 Tax=Deferribacter autotrophicus TaxID=500465 RepID=A0A5A8F236_9BACT|nr:ferrochelatase [Deferribacter autotrophicus]KAA0257801.1 ferrochelatase [Deferribacter autotrophicus]